MNRDLFKAKRKSWKELPKEEWWVEGYLFDDGMPEPKHYFIGGIIVKPYEGTACDKWNVVGIDFYEIDINTLCQYTGLTDKNGKKIWENDILKCKKYIGGNFVDYCIEVGYVEMKHGAFGLHRIKNDAYYRPFKDWLEDYEYEVVGNIFNNPELLEAE